jgi:LPS sulfotransferase NodH
MNDHQLRLFRELIEEEDRPEPTKGLMVLSTPRSGSTLFCDVLTNDGQVGRCDEWFNEKCYSAWREVVGLDEFHLPAYLDFVKRKTTDPVTGIFALHVHIGQLIEISTKFSFAVGDMGFDELVWIYREDKVAQAVSLARAATTGQWKSGYTQEGEPDLSMRNIAHYLFNLTDQDEFYRRAMSQHATMDFAYEQFSTLPCGKGSPWNLVLGALGCEPMRNIPKPNTEKQRDYLSKQAARDFRNYLSGV